jgi:hypothetical protein
LTLASIKAASMFAPQCRGPVPNVERLSTRLETAIREIRGRYAVIKYLLILPSMLLCELPLLNAAPKEGTDPPHWERMLAWFPEDTETIMVSNDPFEIQKDEPKEFKFRDAFRSLPTGPMLSFREGLLRRELHGRKVLCAIEGSRQFTSPTGLGMMPYHGCHAVQFERDSEDAVGKAFKVCEDKAEKKIEVAREKVAVFTEKHDERQPSHGDPSPAAGRRHLPALD